MYIKEKIVSKGFENKKRLVFFYYFFLSLDLSSSICLCSLNVSSDFETTCRNRKITCRAPGIRRLRIQAIRLLFIVARAGRLCRLAITSVFSFVQQLETTRYSLLIIKIPTCY